MTKKDNDDHIPPHVLRPGARWQDLYIYQKSDTLYQLTALFCKRFFPARGERTVDQMVQAARSLKQNIVEGSEDGKTSTEMELNLINVARSSNDELREDYKDYLNKNHLPFWNPSDPKLQPFQEYSRTHNKPEDYLAHAPQWTAEQFCNICLTLCYQVDAMMNRYLKRLDKLFKENGGIKERMYAVRTGYRQQQDEHMRALERENATLKQQLTSLQQQISTLQQQLTASEARYQDLRQRALNAYYHQQDEIAALKKKLGED